MEIDRTIRDLKEARRDIDEQIEPLERTLSKAHEGLSVSCTTSTLDQLSAVVDRVRALTRKRDHYTMVIKDLELQQFKGGM